MDEANEKGGDGPLPKGQEEPWNRGLNPERIQTLCDGIFAIAMTLLVFSLTVPYFDGDPGANDELTGLDGVEFYSYGLGFFALGIYWILYHTMIHYIRRSDGVFVWLSMLFFAFAAMVPFWTEVLNTNYENPDGGRIYALFMILTFLSLLAIWEYATWKRRLVAEDLDKAIISDMKKIILVGVCIITLVEVGTYINPNIGYLLYAGAVWFLITTSRGCRIPSFKKKTKSTGNDG